MIYFQLYSEYRTMILVIEGPSVSTPFASSRKAENSSYGTRQSPAPAVAGSGDSGTRHQGPPKQVPSILEVPKTTRNSREIWTLSVRLKIPSRTRARTIDPGACTCLNADSAFLYTHACIDMHPCVPHAGALQRILKLANASKLQKPVLPQPANQSDVYVHVCTYIYIYIYINRGERERERERETYQYHF